MPRAFSKLEVKSLYQRTIDLIHLTCLNNRTFLTNKFTSFNSNLDSECQILSYLIGNIDLSILRTVMFRLILPTDGSKEKAWP